MVKTGEVESKVNVAKLLISQAEAQVDCIDNS
jgi:hypothetical protein